MITAMNWCHYWKSYMIFCFILLNNRRIVVAETDLEKTILDIFGEPPPDEKSANSATPVNGVNQMILDHFGPPTFKNASKSFNREECRMTASGWNCQGGIKTNDIEPEPVANTGNNKLHPAQERIIRNLFRPMQPPQEKEHDFFDADLGGDIFTEDDNSGVEYKFQNPQTLHNKHGSYSHKQETSKTLPRTHKDTTPLLEPQSSPIPPRLNAFTLEDDTKIKTPIEMRDEAKTVPRPTQMEVATEVVPAKMDENTVTKIMVTPELTHSTTEKSKLLNVLVTKTKVATTPAPNESSCKSISSYVLLLLLAFIVS